MSPEVVTLCGSTRFRQEFEELNELWTLAGRVVISLGVFGRMEGEDKPGTTRQHTRLSKAQMDILHFGKIDLADIVIIINPGGYIGESTERELCYARMREKVVGHAYWHDKHDDLWKPTQWVWHPNYKASQ